MLLEDGNLELGAGRLAERSLPKESGTKEQGVRIARHPATQTLNGAPAPCQLKVIIGIN